VSISGERRRVGEKMMSMKIPRRRTREEVIRDFNSTTRFYSGSGNSNQT